MSKTLFPAGLGTMPHIVIYLYLVYSRSIGCMNVLPETTLLTGHASHFLGSVGALPPVAMETNTAMNDGELEEAAISLLVPDKEQEVVR